VALLGRTFERAAPFTRLSLRPLPLLVLVGAAIFSILLLRVLLTSNLTTTNFTIQQLQRERLEKQTQVAQLEAEAAFLMSLARIEQDARGRLGLVPPVARGSVQVNVAWPGAAEQGLPSRFAPELQAEADEQGSSWWRDLLGLLPF
jgi:cell division protein FtsL